MEPLEDRALLALQGPAAAAVLSRFADGIARLRFMTAAEVVLDGRTCLVTRSGYTGEDGFEISLPAAGAASFAEKLLAQPEVRPVGLGARDSLRLEAGLCLWGHDIDETTTPIEADLAWTIGKRRRAEGGFPGAAIVQRQLTEGAPRKRVGIRPDGRAPAREETDIVDTEGRPIGRVTSGGFGPSVGGPIAMGYVDRAHAAEGSALALLVRGVARPGHFPPAITAAESLCMHPDNLDHRSHPRRKPGSMSPRHQPARMCKPLLAHEKFELVGRWVPAFAGKTLKSMCQF